MAIDNTGMERVLNWQPSPPDSRDFPLMTHLAFGVATPEVVDLPHPFGVEDQSYIGSCTAFGSKAAFEYLLQLMGFKPVMVAALSQYYWTRLEGGFPTNQDTGAYVRDTMKVLSKIGAALSAVYPYNPALFAQEPPTIVYSDAGKRKAIKYVAVPVDISAMETTLAAGYPIVIGFQVPSAFMSTGSNGMVSTSRNNIIGGHCVLVVGYNKATRRFKIRNSWGIGWGAGGYAYIDYDWLMALGSDFWTLMQVVGDELAPPPPTPDPMPSGTWLNMAVRRDGPTSKVGYSTFGKTSPKRGEIKHSAEGGLEGAFAQLDNPSVEASWHFTIGYDRVYQHYPVEANTWHGNDTDADQNVRANIDLVGVEHLGKAGEPLTEFQIAATVELTRTLAQIFNKTTVSRYPTQVGWTLAEHHEIGDTPTACPSGRIPWEEIKRRLVPPAPPEPPAPPSPQHVWLWGTPEAGMTKHGKQQFHWNEGIPIDAYGDYEGLYPGQHWHNEGGVWVPILP